MGIENFLWGTCGFSFGMVVSLWINYVNQREKQEIDYDKINSKLTRGANTRIEELQTEVKTLKKQDSRLAQRLFELEKQLKTSKTQKITEVEPGIVELLQERKPVYMTIAELENQLKTNKKQ